MFRCTVSLVMVLSILNVIVGKAVHEFFEHKHEVHKCKLKGTTHFCEVEITHPDFICNFNFSASFLDNFSPNFNGIICHQELKEKIHFLFRVKLIVKIFFTKVNLTF